MPYTLLASQHAAHVPSPCSESQLNNPLAPSTESNGLNVELATVFRRLAEVVAGDCWGAAAAPFRLSCVRRHLGWAGLAWGWQALGWDGAAHCRMGSWTRLWQVMFVPRFVVCLAAAPAVRAGHCLSQAGPDRGSWLARL